MVGAVRSLNDGWLRCSSAYFRCSCRKPQVPAPPRSSAVTLPNEVAFCFVRRFGGGLPFNVAAGAKMRRPHGRKSLCAAALPQEPRGSPSGCAIPPSYHGGLRAVAAASLARVWGRLRKGMHWQPCAEVCGHVSGCLSRHEQVALICKWLRRDRSGFARLRSPRGEWCKALSTLSRRGGYCVRVRWYISLITFAGAPFILAARDVKTRVRRHRA
jgi:hypothetical protein